MNDHEPSPLTSDDEAVNPLALTLGQGLVRFTEQYLPGRNLATRTHTEYLADLRAALTSLEE